ncbi:MAG TPA: C69 family dipeptidase [Syntrophomonadaceae bacterium]|nr:C69 family dipeptidase [Syntrophomonadaceae bacterium]HNX29166.1 C69 family dipeptidase [Syntrophomonadaceae bacterium]HPR93661.1 C69 family dipeptidase [Syntrophomonadaceae bacterium]
MCDTMVALGNSTRDGAVIFGKNSDRQPNEPHIMIRVPRKTYKKGSRVKLTYIEIDQAEETNEVLMLKPSWIWGCEMGCNEFGLNIGNEAVFTREKYGPESLTGMDMVRLALERCSTSQEALELIVALLERYGQGGNCGFEKPFTYHNSFLIADLHSAWVLETAGKYWAAEKVTEVRSISNGLTIGETFDNAHPELYEHATAKGWCKAGENFNFSRSFSDPLYTYFSGSKNRGQETINCLGNKKPLVTVENMMSILRSHDTETEGKQFNRASLKSVCMHGGGLIGDHTTGSYIASLSESRCLYWVTGCSTPCLAVYKPLWLIDGEPVTFNEDEEINAIQYWMQREALHRMVLMNQIPDLDKYYRERDLLQGELLQKAEAIEGQNVSEHKLLEIMLYAVKREQELVENTIRSGSGIKAIIKGRPYFRHYWQRQNKKLNIF